MPYYSSTWKEITPSCFECEHFDGISKCFDPEIILRKDNPFFVPYPNAGCSSGIVNLISEEEVLG
jgi:hypothetical protein